MNRHLKPILLITNKKKLFMHIDQKKKQRENIYNHVHSRG